MLSNSSETSSTAFASAESEPQDVEASAQSWSALFRYRRQATRQLGSIFKLPLAKRASAVLVAHANDHDKVLEVGAGDRRMQRRLDRERQGIRYESVDIDPHGGHDYRQLGDVQETFDIVVAFEVIEHLSLTDIQSWLPALLARTRPGGLLLLSTPNTFYPPAYLRDATHRTPLCYDELAGLAMAAGWDVRQVLRIYHDPLHRVVLRRYLFGWLFRMLGIDFARQIVLIAQRPEGTSRVRD